MEFEDWQNSNYQVSALRQKCVGGPGTKVEVISVKVSREKNQKGARYK